jgi:hypothetical protein
MIIVACLPCGLVLRVMGDPQELQLVGPESTFWPNSFPCPRCEKNSIGMMETEADPNALSALEVVDLTPQEAFIAFNGLGLPKEQNCTAERVEELFGTPVRHIKGHQTNTNRFILEHIEFWDGTKLYLGAAPSGAIVYRIAPPSCYTKEALHE